MEVIRDSQAKLNFGCDFVVKLPENRQSEKIKLLQLTDMQIIDAEQRRTPDRLREDEIVAWSPDRFDGNFGNHVKSLIAQSKPDLIFITGDMVYGSFDNSGRMFERFCNFMDSFCIPWACVSAIMIMSRTKARKGNVVCLKTQAMDCLKRVMYPVMGTVLWEFA